MIVYKHSRYDQLYEGRSESSAINGCLAPCVNVIKTSIRLYEYLCSYTQRGFSMVVYINTQDMINCMRGNQKVLPSIVVL